MIPPANLSAHQLSILKKYPDYKQFLKDMAPAQLLVNFDEVNTVEQSVSKTRLQLADLEKIYPDPHSKAPVDYIVRWLDFLNRFSNINKQLVELNAVAYMIYKDFKHLYFSDIKIIFEKIMRAEYGPFYGSVDAQRILYAFMQYNVDRHKLMQKKRNDYSQLLEKHLDSVSNDVSTKVRQIMKDKFPDLENQEYWKKRDELHKELLPEALTAAREDFLKKHTEQTSL